MLPVLPWKPQYGAWIVCGLGLLGSLPHTLPGQTPNAYRAWHTRSPTERAAQFQLQAAPTTEPIRVDGVLDEAVWQQAVAVSGFAQKFPADSIPAWNQTQVWVAYDEKMLYLAARCFERRPGEYVITSLQRDFDGSNNDLLNVVLDPFNDQTNGFLFSVTPMGVQREGLMSNTSSLNTDWDNRWYTETRRHAQGWDVEMAIPYKSLRFPADKTSWRINVVRGSLRDNEYSSWVPIPVNLPLNNLLFTGQLVFGGTPPPRPRRNVALIPYVLGSAARDYTKPPASPQLDWQVGGDVKVALGPSLNLDLTVNPDFAQAEVDRQQINLTQFDLFFPERRQFFLENSDLFASFGFSTIRPFFSRRIGLNTPIVAGARLSGKLSRNWRLGLMSVQTEGDAARNLQAQNFAVGAVQRQLGTHTLGLLYVGRQAFDSQLGERGAFRSDDFNRVVGVDFNLQSPNGKWIGKAFYHHSFSPAEVLQRQPYAHAVFLRRQTRTWELEWNHEIVGRDYRADVGFVPRLIYRDPVNRTTERFGFIRLEPSIELSFWPTKGAINNHGPELYVNQYNFLADGRRNDATYWLGYGAELNTSAGMEVYGMQRYQWLPFPLNLGLTNGAFIPAGGYTWYRYGLGLETNQRRLLSAGVNVELGSFYGGTRQSIEASVVYRTQPWAIWTLNAEWNRIRLPQGDADLLLLGPEASVSFSRSVFLSTVLQFNTADEQLAHTTRLQWRFRPMSDLFIVYSDLHDDAFQTQQQGLLVKLVWWLQG